MIQVGRKQTMTVGELIEQLQNYDPNEAVFATWETVYASIRPENFAMDKVDGIHSVIIDVEDYLS